MVRLVEVGRTGSSVAEQGHKLETLIAWVHPVVVTCFARESLCCSLSRVFRKSKKRVMLRDEALG